MKLREETDQSRDTALLQEFRSQKFWSSECASPTAADVAHPNLTAKINTFSIRTTNSTASESMSCAQVVRCDCSLLTSPSRS